MSQARIRILGLVILSTAGMATATAFAQAGGNHPWEEYSRHISSKSSLTALKSDLFGDSVDLYTGRLSFRQVDIDVPGNSSLPLTLARTFSVPDPIAASIESNVSLPDRHDLIMADWELDVPRITTTYAKHLQGEVLGPNGLDPAPQRDFTWPDQRCSGQRVPPQAGHFFAAEYWNGVQASIPNGGELLQPAAGVQMPTSGGGYRWVTAGFTWFSCLTAIKNGTGEGFFAVGPDGTKYWFDWMAAYEDTTLRTSFAYMIHSVPISFEAVYEQELARRRHVLYATRVEDRLGNWVAYEYSNTANSPARLNRIHSNDGREISIAYNAQGRIASATDGQGTWVYSYGGDLPRLVTVTQPDNSQWAFDLGDPIQFVGLSLSEPASCSYPGAAAWMLRDFSGGTLFPVDTVTTLTIAHPSGATGDFEVRPLLHGRSNVPKNCLPVPEGWGPESGAYSDYVRMYWANSLTRKRITGPGLLPLQWDYQYNNSQVASQARSGNTPGYSAPGSWVLGPYTSTRIPEEGKPLTDISTYIIIDPVCLADACAGTVSTVVTGPESDWARYTFGNSYRYNETKLLRAERGTGPAAIAQTDVTDYQLLSVGQPYPAQVGLSRQYKGDSINSTSPRPPKSKTTSRAGAVFSSNVGSFDAYGRPLALTKSSTLTP